MSRVLRRAGGAFAVMAMLAAAGACTAEEEPDAAPAPEEQPELPADLPDVPEPPETDVPAAEDEAAEVPVVLVDEEVLLPASIFPAGTYTFVVEQEGESPHMLSIEGDGVSESTSAVEPDGEPQQMTVTLEPGTYELWSSENGERADGAEVIIEVE